MTASCRPSLRVYRQHRDCTVAWPAQPAEIAQRVRKLRGFEARHDVIDFGRGRRLAEVTIERVGTQRLPAQHHEPYTLPTCAHIERVADLLPTCSLASRIGVVRGWLHGHRQSSLPSRLSHTTNDDADLDRRARQPDAKHRGEVTVGKVNRRRYLASRATENVHRSHGHA